LQGYGFKSVDELLPQDVRNTLIEQGVLKARTGHPMRDIVQGLIFELARELLNRTAEKLEGPGADAAKRKATVDRLKKEAVLEKAIAQLSKDHQKEYEKLLEEKFVVGRGLREGIGDLLEYPPLRRKFTLLLSDEDREALIKNVLQSGWPLRDAIYTHILRNPLFEEVKDRVDKGNFKDKPVVVVNVKQADGQPQLTFDGREKSAQTQELATAITAKK